MATKTNPILRNYRLDFVECRGFDHNWKHYDGYVDHHEYYTVKGKMSECEQCGCIRYRWYMHNGRKFGPNTYEHPEGYRLKLKDYPGLEKLPSREEWRALAMKKAGFRASPNVTTLKPKRKSA